MRARFSSIAVGLFLLLNVASVSALTIIEGRIRLEIDERFGRFSLYYLVDERKSRYEPLYTAEDSRTSYLSLLMDDRVIRLGDAIGFRTRVERTRDGATVRFQSSDLVVTERFTFIRTQNSTQVDAIRLDFECVNSTPVAQNISLRFLLDTNLGEKKNAHFTIDETDLTGELRLVPRAQSRSVWKSKGERVAMMGSIYPEQQTPPTAIHFANWKRLSDATWRIDEVAGRSFSLLPYSVNDSAVAYYFDNMSLPASGGTRVCTILLGAENPEGFAVVPRALSPQLSTQLLDQAQQISGAGISPVSIDDDLGTLSDILYQVTEAIDSGALLSDAEMDAFETLIRQIEERHNLR